MIKYSNVVCPRCGKDISDEQFEIDSEIEGFRDIGYDCSDCGITVYTCKIEKTKDDFEKEAGEGIK